MNSIKDIWIESEVKGAIIEGELYTNDNTDVIVTFDNDKKYIATFFTYQNIEHLRLKNQKTGECNSGYYFWASDMIIIERTDRKSIISTIEYLLHNDEFYSVFNEIST